jgi:hypothetical protein
MIFLLGEVLKGGLGVLFKGVLVSWGLVWGVVVVAYWLGIVVVWVV